MNLFLKVLGFLKPFWKLIVVSTLLTFLYVTFESLTLWVCVDLIRELFVSDGTTQVLKAEEEQAEPVDASDALQSVKEKFDLYKVLNGTVKRLIIQENRFDTLKMVCFIIFLSFLLKNITFYLRRVQISFIELNVIVSIRNKLQEALLYQPVSYFQKHHSGQLASIVFNDVKSVNQVLNNSFGTLLLTPVQIIINITLMLIFSWQLTLFTMILFPICGLIIYKIGQSIRRKSRRVFQQISNVMALFQDAIAGIRIVKAFTSETREKEKFQKENFKYLRYNFRANKLSFVTSPLNETFGALMLIALLWYGGQMVFSNTGMDAEKFVRFMVFLFASFKPLKELSGINNTVQTGMAAAERIFGIIDSPPEVYDWPAAKRLENFQTAIKYDRVSFQYTGENPDVLTSVSLEIKKGETVALVGPSGSGKTTLVNLLPRFYEIKSGSITIDQTDIRDFSLPSLRGQIGLVTQESILFNDTVRANIAYGNISASEEEINHAARIANAMEFIEQMDKGFDSIIGEKGGKLSGGQKQRLSIARAILKNPPILILDEATSALDTESERLVQDAIDHVMKNRTVLVIAHRLSTVIHADKIVVMQQGEIIGTGKHTRLLESCPLYRMLYEMQFQNGQKR
jgi:subfamily B ATP-binding cassette protein MsbA